MQLQSPPRSPLRWARGASSGRRSAWIVLVLASVFMALHMLQHDHHGLNQLHLRSHQQQTQLGTPSLPASSTPSVLWKKLALTPWLGQRRQTYAFPKIILQTVANKHSISCEALQNIQSWTTLNPRYKQMLFDDADIHTFMEKYYPQHLDTFQSLNSSVERADMWRYLALHTYGGVYADTDVRCMRPIKEWNAEHGHDAKVLIGLEGVKQSWHRGSQFLQWTIAAMPGHPLLLSMAGYIKTFKLRDSLLDQNDIVLHRTGPARWTDAILDYMGRNGGVPGTSQLEAGVRVADIRILPMELFALGWGQTCEQAAHKHPETYICHQFYGSWKTQYHHAKPQSTACKVPEELLVPLEL